MRIDCLELRKLRNSDKWEIVKWQPNPYYGNESKYIKTSRGYTESRYGFVVINESCFKNPETCYAIAFIDNGIPKYVGNRPLELDGIVEILNFLKLLRKGVSASKHMRAYNGQFGRK